MFCLQASLTEQFGLILAKKFAASLLSKRDHDCSVHCQCHQLVDNKGAM